MSTDHIQPKSEKLSHERCDRPADEPKDRKRFKELMVEEVCGEAAAPSPFALMSCDASETQNVGALGNIDTQMELMSAQILEGIYHVEENGVKTTTLILNPPNPHSAFNGAEIVIEQFETANGFNIGFFGNEHAVELFAGGMAGLELALRKEIKDKQINLKTPLLKTRPYAKRVNRKD